MAVTKAKKQEIIKKFKTSDLDTGSSEVQVALLTERITQMTAHLAQHKKDVHTQFGLVNCVNQRRRLLNYLKRTNSQKYDKVVSALDLRK